VEFWDGISGLETVFIYNLHRVIGIPRSKHQCFCHTHVLFKYIYERRF